MQTLFVLLVGMLVTGAGTALGIIAHDEARVRAHQRARCSADE